MSISDKLITRGRRILNRPLIARFPDRPVEQNSDLSRIVYGHQGRLVYKWDHYIDIYERHLARFRNTDVRLLEIGVKHGGSLEIWRKYFGDRATIYGVDIDARCQSINQPPSINVRIGSQADQSFLLTVLDEMGGLDIVIDDGSHRVTDQRISFSVLFERLSETGVYIAEDLHTNYWRGEFEGGWKRRSTFIEQMKDLVDDIHSFWHNKSQRHPGAHLRIGSITFYDSVVVIERSPQQSPVAKQIGRPSF